MQLEPKWTHKGWCMFCPVKLADVDTDNMIIAARWGVLEPLLTVANFAQGLVITLCSLVIEDYEPQFWFKITGEYGHNG